MWADSKWTSEKLQLEMQVVKSVNGFICTGCTGGQIQFGGKHGHVCFVAAEGPPPLNEISRLNGKVFHTRDGVQKKVNNKARPNVWAKLKTEREDGEVSWTTQDPWNKNTKTMSTGCAKQTEEGERPRSKSKSDSSLSDMHIDGDQIGMKTSKPPAAFEEVAQQETRKGMQELEQQMNQQVHSSPSFRTGQRTV